MSDDTTMRVKRDTLIRWRQVAERQRAPLNQVIDRALVELEADPNADAALGRAVRVATDQHPPRRRKGATTVPLVFDAADAAAERHAALDRSRCPGETTAQTIDRVIQERNEYAEKLAAINTSTAALDRDAKVTEAIGIIAAGIGAGHRDQAPIERARNIAHALAHLIAPDPRTRGDLVARWRELSRALNDERLPESDWRAVTRERDAVQAEIDALDRASKETP